MLDETHRTPNNHKTEMQSVEEIKNKIAEVVNSRKQLKESLNVGLGRKRTHRELTVTRI